ncbi:hypothetical protein [Geothrix oryzisoli]|uniref:hypothetical protein n=1 Tax=Geothrix oryzisoli TaxID=2922721 RepID=UPI001FAB39CC|nr:hypothetical protein [Geothrix oryzisoli]
MNFGGGPIQYISEQDGRIEALHRLITSHLALHDAKDVEKINKTFLDEWMKIQIALYDKISAFNQVVVSLAYAGYFAGVSVCRSYMPPKLLTVSVILMLISISGFITHEIVAMRQRQSTLRAAFALSLAENPGGVLAAYARYQIEEADKAHQRAIRTDRFFWFVLAFGGTSGILLISGTTWIILKGLLRG